MKFIDFIKGNTLPDYFLDALNEFLSGAALNFSLQLVNATTIKVPAGTGNDQVSISLSGDWRYNSADATAAHPGGSAGVYDIWVTSTANDFSGDPPNIDQTNYAFGLTIKAQGYTWTGGDPPLRRKVGTLDWDGSSITALNPLAPLDFSLIAMQILGFGTLAQRPAASSRNRGKYWWASDTKVLSQNQTGSAWQDIVGASVPTGVVLDWPYAAGDVPSGYLLPYGQAVSRTDYAALHALAASAGYPHGSGNGTSTFNLPDYRGRQGVGVDNMGGSAANRVTAAGSGIAGATLGAAGGFETHTLTIGEMPSHTHGVSDPGHSHLYRNPQYNGAAFGAGSKKGSDDDNPDQTGTSGTGISLSTTGGGAAHSNMQPVIVVNKILKT